MAMKKNKEKEQSKNISREPLDIEKIVKAALKLLNEVGLQQLTTRRLAEALGIRSASLYWHIKNKAELLQLLAESISSKLHLPDRSLPWNEQVLNFAMEYRATLLTIRDSAEILLDTPPLTPNRLFLVESNFVILANAGFPNKEIVMASMLINDYVLSFVKNEMIMSNRKLSQGISTQEMMNNLKKFFSNLSPDKYPIIISLADYMANQNMDEHYEYGLQILIESFKQKLNNK